MASIPAQQPSRPQSRASHDQPQPPPSSSSPVRTRSATSEDSQTLFLNTPPTDQQEQSDQSQSNRPYNPDDDPSIKKCWICMADATEDTPETSPWRDPCPCALVAHEECLLDWIADLEGPKNIRNRPIVAPKIECPQCKTEIKLSRPRDYLVEAVRSLERVGAQMTLPGAATVLMATVYTSSMAWGVHSIYAIFGAEDGFRILRPLLRNAMRAPVEVYINRPQKAFETLLGVFLDHLVHWRLYVGLPLITPIIVLSRTKFADPALPVLPIIFFATQTHSTDEGLDFTHWPPSASLAFALLPYVRSAYNYYYDKVWAEREKRWMKEIQPRSSQPQNDGNAANADAANANVQDEADDGNVFEVRIDGGVWEDWEDEDEDEEDDDAIPPLQQADPVQPPQQQQPPAQVAEDILPGAQADPPPNIQDDRRPNPAQPQPQQPARAPAADRRLSFSPTLLAETILGALLFPTISGLSGELLKALLPLSLTTRSAPIMSPASFLGGRRVIGRSAGGLLQEKWARSLVGGCVFVVVKDLVGLYVRWRMVEMHRRRRVVEWRERGGRGGVGWWGWWMF